MTNPVSVLRTIYAAIAIYAPGEMGDALRKRYYGKRLRHLGRGARIDIGVQISNPEHVSIGADVWVDKYVVINAGPPTAGGRHLSRRPNPSFGLPEGHVEIGARTHVAPHVVINGHGGVLIQEDCGIAAGSRIYSLSHHHRNPDDPTDTRRYLFTPLAPADLQSLICSPVVIKRRSAIALNCVVLPGATIGEECWVTVGSLVQGDLPSACIASGAPASPVKQRAGYEKKHG